MNESIDTMKTLLQKMDAAINEEHWAVVISLNTALHQHFEQLHFDVQPATIKQTCKNELIQIYQAHQKLLQKCSDLQNLNGQALSLLRKQKAADTLYQQVQTHS